eukprot:EG_transcript_26955
MSGSFPPQISSASWLRTHPCPRLCFLRSPTPLPRRRNRSLRLDQSPLASKPAPEPSARVGTPPDMEPQRLPNAGRPMEHRAVNGVQLAWHTLDLPKESPRTVLPRRRVVDVRACTPGIHRLS